MIDNEYEDWIMEKERRNCRLDKIQSYDSFLGYIIPAVFLSAITILVAFLAEVIWN